MSPSSTIELEINEKAHNYAQVYSSLLTDEFQRKRAYASITALYALTNLLEKTGNEIETQTNIFRNPILNEQFEIADLYVNNWHIDVRVITEGNAFLVPKCHFDNNIVPDFYCVIKIDKSLKTADLLGFADTQTMKKEGFDYHYFSVANTNLMNYAEFLTYISAKKKIKFTEAEHELFRGSYLSLLDGEIDKSSKNKILKHLFECSECRNEFCCFTGFEMVNKNLCTYPEILHDQTLNIIGAQAADEEKYSGKEETVYITEEEPKEVISDIEPQTTVEEIKTQEIKTQEIITENIEPENIEEETTSEEEKTNEPELQPQEDTESDTSVSDIIDTFFGSDENDTSELEHEEKPIDISLEDDSDTVENTLIESIPEHETITLNENLSIEDNSDNSNADLTLIEEENTSANTDESESNMLILDDNTQDTQEEIKFNDIEENSSDLIIEEPVINENNDMQKVIIDYDEFGEPIYSYIKDVDEKDLAFVDKISPETDTDNSVETIPTETEQENISEIQDTDTKEDVNNIENSEIEEFEEYKETPVESENIIEELSTVSVPEADYNVQETEDENVQSYDQREQYEYVGQAPTEEDYINLTAKDDSDEVTQSYTQEEEYPQTNNENDNTYEEYKDDDTDEDLGNEDEDSELKEYDEEYDEENGEEDSDYDDENEEDDEVRQTDLKKKKNMMILFFIVILLAIGGSFFIMKNINSVNNTTVANNTESQTGVVDENGNSVNDMFEQPSDSDTNGEENTDINEEENNQENVSEEGTEADNSENNGQEEAQGNEESSNQEQEAAPIEIPPVDNTQEQAPLKSNLTEKDLQEQNNAPIGDVNKVMSNAFSQGGSNVSLSGINWQCAPSLFTDKEFKTYLQKIDSVLKLNLKKNLLNATQTPSNNTIKIKLAIDNDGNLIRKLISESSGSNEIDEIVLQSLNETLELEKTQILSGGEQKADKYYLLLAIKL